MANEKRLIDANAIPYEEHYVPDGDVQWEYKKELCVCKPAIDQMPTVDAVEVVHGRWEKAHIAGYLKCNCCKDAFIYEEWLERGKWSYCPNCGAKMDKNENP